jgi:hypothetical protein
MKLDCDERTHQKTLEDTRRHETKAKTERPPEEAAQHPLRLASLVQKPTTFPFM